MTHTNDLRNQLDIFLRQAAGIVSAKTTTDHADEALRAAFEELAQRGNARTFRRTLASLRHQIDPDAVADLVQLYLRILTLRGQLHRAELELLAV